MGTGYVRNDVSNNIAPGNPVQASDFDGEYDAIQAAFAANTGHTHDGTVGEGGPVSIIGPAQEITVGTNSVLPKTDNTIDLGSSSFSFRDGWFDRVLYVADGSAANPSVAFGLDANTGFYRSGTDEFVITTGGLYAAYADAGQNWNISNELYIGDSKATGGGAIVKMGESGTDDFVITPTDQAGGYSTSENFWFDRSAARWKFTGDVQADSTFYNNALSGGTIDGATIGATTAAAGTFTSVTTTTGNITSAFDVTANRNLYVGTASAGGGSVMKIMESGNDFLMRPTDLAGGYTSTDQLWHDHSLNRWRFSGDMSVEGTLIADLSTISGSGDLAVADGGTGASTASAARTNLGVAIGSNVQAWDANLDQIAALAVTNGNFIVGNGSAWVVESGSTARASLGLGSLATLNTINNSNWSGTDLAVGNGGTGSSTASGARSNLGLAIGVNVQAYDADLSAYASNPLTNAELDQLQNINATTISATQWGYVGGLNQALTTSSPVTFERIVINANDVDTQTDLEFTSNAVVGSGSGSVNFTWESGGALKFWDSVNSKSGGIAGGSEHLRINSAGVTVSPDTFNTASAGGDGIRLTFAANSQIQAQHGSGVSANSDIVQIFYGSTQCFEVQTDGDVNNTNNSYGAISAFALKNNIVDVNSQLDDIMGVRLRNFDWDLPTDTPEQKAGRPRQLGVVAEELKEVSPGLVKEQEDGTYYVQYSILYLKLLKAFQELVEDYERKVGPITRNNNPTAAAALHNFNG